MLAASEAGEVVALLEGGCGGAREAADALVALYASVREPWLVRGLLLHHARTGSARALDVLSRAPDPHARHLLDALHEQLRGERPARHHALAALAPLVARRPPWLHRLTAHPLARDLLRAARHERDPPPLLHALLALAALLPAAPAFAAPHWPELADALLRPAALDPPPAPPARHHLLLAQLALFHALYATHPCTLVDTLRAELGTAGARAAWERSLAPLLRSVRLHPALLTGSRAREADATRWARLELHDVVAEARRLSLHTPERCEEGAASAPPASAPLAPASPAPGSGAHAARAAAALRPGAEPWFALGDRCGADSAPHTPLPAEPDTAEPPEAAVEATPENTPAKETRGHFSFPAGSGAVRAIGRKETSPPAGGGGGGGGGGGEGYTGRLSRVMAERRAADSPVSFGGAPPAAVARPEPRGAGGREGGTDAEPLNVEDREVLELTARARLADAWGESAGGGAGGGAGAAMERARALDPRRGALAPPPRKHRARHPPPRRPASCPPRRAAPRTDAAVQTADTWPEPYEFLIADFYRSLPDEPQGESSSDGDPVRPCERLDAYLSELYAGGVQHVHVHELAEQLALAHAQLLYERWRREAHAERNRRLLGRCRRARALELQNAALHERVRALQRERDEMLARLSRAPPSAAPTPGGAGEREARLEAALAEQSSACARAEAALCEAQCARSLDAAELQRTRAESFEAARHVEALARAALAAERRAEHVRRLRRELLILAERDARTTHATDALHAAAAAARADGTEERALRAACSRLEAEAAGSAARAEAATARLHELEAQLGARDAAAAELRRVSRVAAEEHAARLRALKDKYETLMRVVRAQEGRHLERLAGGERGAPNSRAAPAPHPAPAEGGAAAAGARLAPADCGRTRRLLEMEEADS